MPEGLRLRVIFCEDVRREMGNKLSYMGVFGPAIFIPKGQAIEKLFVAAHLHAEPSVATELTFVAVEVIQRSADGTTKTLQEAEPKATAFDEAEWNSVVGAFDLASRPDVLTVGLVVLRDLQVEEPASVEVRVKTNLGELRGSPLLIIPGGLDSATSPTGQRKKPKESHKSSASSGRPLRKTKT